LYSFDVCIAHAVQCSSFNKLAGWHSDEHWSELITMCSFMFHLILCGCHINVHVIVTVILIMIDQRKKIYPNFVKCVLKICWKSAGNFLGWIH